MVRLMAYDGDQNIPVKQDQLEVLAITGGLQSTVTVITSIPSSVASGASFSASGTVKTPAGANITNGTVQMQYNSGSGWQNRGSAASVTAGTFTCTGLSQTSASLSWRALYTPGSGNAGSNSATKTVKATTVQTYTKTYPCIGSASYQQGGSMRSGVSEAYQGYYSSTNGNQRSVLIFDWAQIAADLAGATITKTEIYLNALHWGPDSGGTAIIGTHTYTSVPASNPSTANADLDRVAWSTKTGGKWSTITNAIGNGLKAGTSKGILLGPGPSTALEYYGYFAGNGQTGEPQLRITYTK